MVTHPTMNGSTGDEVHPPPKNFGQSLRKILDLPPQTHTRFQRKQEINVAIRASIPTRHGTENFKARDPVAFTQIAQTFLVHDLDRHAQSLDATQPIPRQRFTEPHPELRRRHPVAPRFAGPIVERQPYGPTPALPSNASLPVERQRYSASKRPQGKRTPGNGDGWHPNGNTSATDQRQPSRRTPALSTETPAFLSNASATAQANDHKTSEPRATATDGTPTETPALRTNASPPVERLPSCRTPALQRKHTTTRQANPGRRRRMAASTW